jgi:hypothetical protein
MDRVDSGEEKGHRTLRRDSVQVGEFFAILAQFESIP